MRVISMRNAVFAVHDGAPTLATTLKSGFWPGLQSDTTLRPFAMRYSEAGAQLRSLAAGGADTWAHIDRGQIVNQLRVRLRDPAVMQQRPTGLCGPLSVVFELARRRPADYVRAAAELLASGRWTTVGGKVIEAEQELRNEPVPSGLIEQVDWLLAATMRDDANLWEDVDSGDDGVLGFLTDNANGLETLTLWGAMADWTHHVLGLAYHWETTFVTGELKATRRARDDVAAGGVAYLLIDKNLIEDGGGDDDREMWWRAFEHPPKTSTGALSGEVHAMDDGIYPDHWVVFLGDLELGDDDGPISLRVWSWGREYVIRGAADDLGEYLYAVVTGHP